MPSSWIIERVTGDGSSRYLVRYRVGGRDTRQQYAGSFTRKADALARRRWVDGELAAMRAPDLATLGAEPKRAPTFAEACDRWRAGRVDVAEATQVVHRVALGRVVPILGSRRIDEIAVEDVNRLITELAAAGRKRETIRKSVMCAAAVLDDAGVDPNPFRHRRVRLPHEEPEEIVPPSADHVEAVFRLLARTYRLPLLVARLVRCPCRVDRLDARRRLRRAGAAGAAASGHDQDAARSMG